MARGFGIAPMGQSIMPPGIGAAATVLSLATWRVTAANYSGSGDWLDEVGSTDAALPGSGSDPSWDGANTEWDFAQADPAIDYLTMGNASVVNPGAGDWSAAVRVKVGNVTERHHIFGKDTDTAFATAGWSMEIAGDVANDPFRVICADGSSNVIASVNSMTAGTYRTLAVSFDASGNMVPYVNGTAGTGADVSSLGSLSNSVAAILGHLAGLTATNNVGLNGSLRAAVFWKGTVLTAAQQAEVHTELVALEP